MKKLVSALRQPLFLKSLYLKNFRNYKESSFAFSPKCNVIFGKNAQGKTSLLEAISLITTGRSFRSQHLTDLIRDKEPYFYIEAEIIQGEISQTIKLYFDGTTKKLQLNANSYTSLSPLLGIAPCVISVPEDLSLIISSPIHRRRFLNVHLAQSDPLYVHHLSRYVRSMKQRNTLLKMKKPLELDCWEIEMACSASYLHQARTKLTNQLKVPIIEQSQRLSENFDQVTIEFQSTHPPTRETYKALLERSRKKEMILGLTLHGPHRDDLHFMMNQKLAKVFASEGQKKTLVTALRLAEWHNLKEQTENSPLMLIDDFGSALDQRRESLLATQLQVTDQLFLTTPTPLLNFPDSHTIEIDQGRALGLSGN